MAAIDSIGRLWLRLHRTRVVDGKFVQATGGGDSEVIPDFAIMGWLIVEAVAAAGALFGVLLCFIRRTWADVSR